MLPHNRSLTNDRLWLVWLSRNSPQRDGGERFHTPGLRIPANHVELLAGGGNRVLKVLIAWCGNSIDREYDVAGVEHSLGGGTWNDRLNADP